MTYSVMGVLERMKKIEAMAKEATDRMILCRLHALRVIQLRKIFK